MAYWDPLLDVDLLLNLVRARVIECKARGVPRASYLPSLMWDLADAMAEYDADGVRWLMALPIPEQAKVNLDERYGDLFAECYLLLTDVVEGLGALGAGPVEEPPRPPEVPERRPEAPAEARAAEEAASEAVFDDPGMQYVREVEQAWEATATDRTGTMRQNALRAAARRYANRLSETAFKTSVRTEARLDEIQRRAERDDVRRGARTEPQDKASLGSRIWDSVKKHPGWTVITALIVVSGAAKYLLNESFYTAFGVRPLPPAPRCKFMSTPYGTIIGAVVGVGTGWLFSRYLAEEF